MSIAISQIMGTLYITLAAVFVLTGGHDAALGMFIAGGLLVGAATIAEAIKEKKK